MQLNNKKLLLKVIVLLFIASPVFGQLSWTVNPFEQKVFIENKGQYKEQEEARIPGIVFGARLNGLDYYFTKDAIWIKHDKSVKLTESEIKNLKVESEEKETKDHYKSVAEFYSIRFLSSSPSVIIIPEGKVSQTYNFGMEKETAVCRAYEKIIYRNLYSGIDMEFYFPKDKPGFKYDFIVHPGADASQIEMEIPFNEGIIANDDGDLNIRSAFGTFIDHAPVSSCEGSSGNFKVGSSFKLQENIISFNVDDYDKRLPLRIDPWNITPVFNTGSRAYEVDWDYQGNCYVYGGDAPPYQLIKYNSASVQQWAYTAVFPHNTLPFVLDFGDFTVDKKSQSVYIAQGCENTPAPYIYKINSAGVKIGSNHGTANFREIWRLNYSSCSNEIIVAGGGTTSPSFSLGHLDTNMNTLTPVNIFGNSKGQQDVWSLALDSSGNGYIVLCQTQVLSPFDNHLIKFPVPALSPMLFSVNADYHFGEAITVQYVKGTQSWTSEPNGFNGLATSSSNVYTYDSYIFKKWSAAGGAYGGGIPINTMTSAQDSVFNLSGDGTYAHKVYWGGITSDLCDHVFIGSKKNVLQYDGAGMSLVNTFPMQDTIYDVNLDARNNLLYVCGNNFLTVMQTTLPASVPAQLTASVTAAVCTCNGTASAIISGGNCSNAGSFTYNWMPGGQTTSNLTGLCPGTYTVTTRANSTCGRIIGDTAVVTVAGGVVLSTSITATQPTCTNNIGSAAVNILSGAGPYTYNWNPTGETTSGITGLSGGTYSVTTTDGAGCTEMQAIQITPSGTVVATAGPNSTICAGQAVTLTSSGGNNYLWSNGSTGTAISISPTTTTTYSVIVSSGSCADTAYTAVVVGNMPPPVITGNTSLCTGDIATLTASGGDTYSWSTGETTSVINVNPTSTSVSYSVTATNTNGCTSTATVDVTVSAPPVATANSSTICSGETATLSASGGANYQWSNGNTTPAITISPTGNTTYSVIVSVGSCSDTAYTSVAVNPSPSVTITGNTNLCKGDIATLTASGSNNYIWSSGTTNAIINVSPTVTTTYSVTTTNGNCTSAASITVTVSPTPVANASPSTICAGQTTIITATGGGTYIWNTGQTDNLIIVSPPASTNYSVIVSIGSCKDTANASVQVNPVPAATAYNNVTITEGQNTTLAASGGGTYLWDNGATDSLITVSPDITTIYCVTVDNGNCTDTACVTVSVEPINCTPVSTGDAFVLPSAFSPNADGQNDKWRLLYVPLLADCLAEFQVYVYNRWGEKIFEGTDINFIWDGTYKGKMEETAVFGYYITGTLKDGTKIKKQGNISLLR